MKAVTLITHPLVQHKLTRLRNRETEPEEFRRVLGEAAALMIYEATRSFETREIRVRTPLESTTGARLRREIVLVPILRAGLGMLGPILQLLPGAKVGFVGLKRDETTLAAAEYHRSLPSRLEAFEVVAIDPMLATGGSAVAMLNLLRARRARRVRLVTLIAAPEGIDQVRRRHPQVPIYTAAVDRQLNERGFILPGLGDAGDRLFGI